MMDNNKKFNQSLNQEQSLGLMPQQLLTVKFLSLSSQEMEIELQRIVEENPALEENNDTVNDDSFKDEDNGKDEFDNDWELGEYSSSDDIPEYKLREIHDRNQRFEQIPFAATAPNLIDIIENQIDMMQITNDEKELAYYILGNMSDDGYIRRSTEDIVDDLFVNKNKIFSIDEVENAFKIIQSCEPCGVGARDLRECLLLQLRNIDPTNTIELAILMLTDYYDTFTTKRFDKLKNQLKTDNETIDDIYRLIGSLNPKPGATLGYSSIDKMDHLSPDFVVMSDENGDLTVSIVGERDIAPLRLSKEYVSLANKKLTGKNISREQKNAQQFIRHKIDQAKWIIDALGQRQRTLRLTINAIVKRQYKYFLTGDQRDINTMVLRQLSDDTGLDISTISRVTSTKNVQTDFGIIPLKSLFSEGVKNSQGEDVSQKGIKATIIELIENEDSKNPLGDQEIVSLLSERGYDISRRTVSKYRDELNIPRASMRKTLK